MLNKGWGNPISIDEGAKIDWNQSPHVGCLALSQNNWGIFLSQQWGVHFPEEFLTLSLVAEQQMKFKIEQL